MAVRWVPRVGEQAPLDLQGLADMCREQAAYMKAHGWYDLADEFTARARSIELENKESDK